MPPNSNCPCGSGDLLTDCCLKALRHGIRPHFAQRQEFALLDGNVLSEMQIAEGGQP